MAFQRGGILLPTHTEEPSTTASAPNLLYMGWMESSSRIRFLSFCIDMICSQKYILSLYPLHRERLFRIRELLMPHGRTLILQTFSRDFHLPFFLFFIFISKDICMKTGYLFLKISSTPTAYSQPEVRILSLWHHNPLRSSHSWCHRRLRLQISNKQQAQINP